ncbi:MAG: SDR family oxidoreductase [Chitinophagaceae bacterium]
MNIVITGASRGIGKAIAEKFAQEGHNLLLCSQSAHALYQTLEELQLTYPRLVIKARPADLSNKNEVLKFAEWVTHELKNFPTGKIDIIVNNAGRYSPGQVYNEPEGTLEEMININLYAAYNLTRALVPKMIEQRGGYIFNICSIASIQPYKNGGSYGISKFALLGFTKNLREEMKEFGVRVTAILPGAVYTDSWIGSGLPQERFISAQDIASTIFNCSQLSASATVEDIVIRPQDGDI